MEVRADWSEGDLVVTVLDRGPGFTPSLLARLGQQVQTTKAFEGGMGLGLMLSAASVERLGGTLRLANEPAGGARAEIRVPLRSIKIEPPTEMK